MSIADDDNGSERVTFCGDLVIFVAEHNGAKVFIISGIEIATSEVEVFIDVVSIEWVSVTNNRRSKVGEFLDFAIVVEVEVFDFVADDVLSAEMFNTEVVINEMVKRFKVLAGKD